jgi:hypothetical protein
MAKRDHHAAFGIGNLGLAKGVFSRFSISEFEKGSGAISTSSVFACYLSEKCLRSDRPR